MHHPLVTIQYLRALASTGVVVHHFMGPAYFDHGLEQPFSIGAGGVDLFFVISGFIIWTTTSHRNISSLEFIKKRLLRIVPLYWIFTLVFLVMTLASRHAPIQFWYVGKSLLFIPGYDEHLGERTAAFYFPGWTLMYEMFFYVLFALVLVLPKKVSFKALIGSLLFLVILGLTFNFKGGASFTYTSPLLLEFVAGCTIGKLYEQRHIPSKRWGIWLIGIGLGLFILTCWSLPASLIERSLVWGSISSLIVLGSIAAEADPAASRSNVGVLLGNASYSIYMSHIVVFFVFNLIVKRSGIVLGFKPELLFYGVVGSFFALVAGVAVYGIIEKQFVPKTLTMLTVRNKLVGYGRADPGAG